MEIQHSIVDFDLLSTNTNTNRTTTHSDSRFMTDTGKIEELIISCVEQNTTDLSSYFESLVKGFNSPLCLENQTFYRGIDYSRKTLLTSNKIGPSPKSKDGRYNFDGEKCIYLIDTIEFLFAELNDASSILVQKYEIPIDKLKIADLSPNNKNLDNSLALAFEMSESGRTSSSGYPFEEKLNKRKAKYLVSLLLSSPFKKYKWDGLYIPGVHGYSGQHYHNLIIWGDAVDKWGNWAVEPYYFMNKEMKQ